MGYAERSYSYRFGSGGFGGSSESGSGGFGRFMTPWVKRLLVANGVVFLFVNLLGIPPLRWAARHLGFLPGSLLTHPWTPITYMFVHGGVWHIFANMLVLFFFGPPLERAWGQRAFLRYYVVAGLGAVVLSLLLLPFLPDIGSAPVVGASGAIYAVMLAFAMTWPNAPVYVWGIFPIKAKWLVGGLAAFALYATFFGGSRNVADWAHLGGLASGFVYLRYGRRIERALDRAWGRVERLREGRTPRLQVEEGGASGGGRGGGRESGPRRGSRGRGGSESGDEDLDRVNEILDKIQERGIGSLTDEERRFLEEVSRRYRGPSQ